ncbi:uncharacterized protein LOC116346006 isoform X2 [Contarinia nasturtii]|uniref:uncharacterized protein LOC116346006 isoform X2 n=1 Tax=Contarinia nasturtii TaxID=265458 RepID=UPI0012D48924|nr:uncharacterized protein LOC116346006 isoform X2 [Contarinia nasturtii]
MDNEIDGADECQPTTSNTNVRIKVSSLVTWVRTKSPAVVQKWVDSDTIETICDSLQYKTITVDDKLVENCDEKIRCASTTESNVVEIAEQTTELSEQYESNPTKLNSVTTYSEFGKYETLDKSQPHHQSELIEHTVDSANSDRRFWQKAPAILTALRIRSVGDSNRCTETDLNVSPQLPQSDEPDESSASNIQPILNKTKLNEFYYKLSINKKRYNFIKDRKMEAKKILNNAKSRFLAATNWDETKLNNDSDNVAVSDDHGDDNLIETGVIAIATETTTMTTTMTTATTTATIASESEANATIVCDTIDMDLSTDECLRLSQSNDMLSVDDEDGFNISMPSINDGHIAHLNVSRKIAMADIGRSTSDNPRLRNKFYLADIGRSFSEHQDDEAIFIGERNISAPSSSIAIQNNNRSNGNFFERRAYSVSPTQRGLKRGMLSRDHSLSDSPRHRNQLSKGSSFQSDSSHCSSVESLLDARKPDSEAILRQLGFGPAHQEDLLSRIPKRFLKPSQVRGIDTEAFMRQQQIANNLHEQSILGYRGLTDDRMQILQRFQPHCHFTSFEEEIHTFSQV